MEERKISYKRRSRAYWVYVTDRTLQRQANMTWSEVESYHHDPSTHTLTLNTAHRTANVKLWELDEHSLF